MKKRVTLLTSLLAVSGLAHAADTTEFKWNAELRGRFHSDYEMAVDLPSNLNVKQQTWWEQRNKLAFTATKGEGLAGHVTLLNNLDWGRGAAIGQPSAGSANDLLFVSEAYAWWKATENIGLRLGRMSLTVADGSVIATNDWQRTPFTFDGAGLIFDYDFAKISALGVVAKELGTTYEYNNGNVSGIPQDLSTGTGNRDPEIDFYGVSVDAKNTPDWLKLANIHYIIETQGQNNAGGAPTVLTQLTDGATTASRYGITLGGEAANFDYSATYAGLNGTSKLPTLSDVSLNSNMYQATVGYKMPEFLGFHIDVTYHQDSGNSSTTTQGQTYQPFFYDRQKFGGQMQIIGWGNLTYIQGDASVSPSDNTTAGVKYTVYSRTQSTDSAYYANMGPNAFANASGGSNAINSGTFNAATGAGTPNTSDKSIGSELNVYANHGFDNNFTVEARYGMFTPSDYLKNNRGGGTPDTATQYYLEGKFVF